MNPAIYIPILCVVISLVVGLASGWGGALMGVRLSQAKMEEWRSATDKWRDLVDGNINRLTTDVSAHRDDILVLDVEVGELRQAAGLARVRRQFMR